MTTESQSTSAPQDVLALRSAVGELLESDTPGHAPSAETVAQYIADQEISGVVYWKEENVVQGQRVGPITFATTSKKPVTGDALWRPFDPDREDRWFTQQDAEWLAKELGARFEEH